MPKNHIIEPSGGTVLPTWLVQAYLDTEYRVHLTDSLAGMTLRVGQANFDLLHLMRRHGRQTAAFITAYNPLGRSLSDAENRTLNAKLQQELTQRSLLHWSGIGQGADDTWPGEESFLVLGLDLAAAQRLGQDCDQNAFVWTGVEAVPRLVLLR